MTTLGRMRKVIALIIALGAALSAVQPIANASSVETTLFSDNFDGYLLGSFPSDFVANTWEIVWRGRGENYVTYGPSVSFPQSLQLWGTPNNSAVAQRKFSTDAPVIGYEYHIQIEAIGTGGPGRAEHPGFFSREAATWGRGYATVAFNHDTRRIEAEDGTVLGSWAPRTWYRVKVVLDRQTNRYSVWIDGRLAGQNLQTQFDDTHRINAMALMSGHPGVKVWYDDVRVFTVAALPGPELQATLQTNRGCGDGAVFQIGEQMQVLFRVEGTGQAYVRLLNILPTEIRTITQQTVTRGQTAIIPGTAGAPAGVRRLRLEVWENATAFNRGERAATTVDCVFTIVSEPAKPVLAEYRVRVLRADWEDPTVMVDPPHAEMVILEASPTGRPGDTLRLAWLPQDQPWPRPAAQHSFRIWVGRVEFWGMPYDAVVRYERDNQPPVASFTFSPTDPSPGQIITFDGRASHDPDGYIVSHAWQFGDGTTATGATVTHSYAAAGTYTVWLTVTDNQGATGSEQKVVRVRTVAPVGDYGDAPDPGFPSLYASGGPVHLDVSQEWIGSGTRSTTTTEGDSLQVDRDFDDGEPLFWRQDGKTWFSIDVSYDLTRSSPHDHRYLNVLVDIDGNGRWDGGDEWAVRNFEIPFSSLPPDVGTLTLILRVPDTIDPARLLGRWVRVTLSDREVPDGSGAWGVFDRGETEDHKLQDVGKPHPKAALGLPAPSFDPKGPVVRCPHGRTGISMPSNPGNPFDWVIDIPDWVDKYWIRLVWLPLRACWHPDPPPCVRVAWGELRNMRIPRALQPILGENPAWTELIGLIGRGPHVLQAWFEFPRAPGHDVVRLEWRVVFDPEGTYAVSYDWGEVILSLPDDVTPDVVTRGRTDWDGQFTVTLEPGVTLTGSLTECTVRPIPNALFAVGLWPRGETFGLWPRGETFTIEDLGGVTFYVPGYEDITVTEFTLHMTELEDEATETGDDALQGEILGLVPFTGLNGQYAVRLDVGVLCLTRAVSEVRVRGSTDQDGEFTVVLGTTTTISGFLADWTQRSLDLLSNQEFEIYLHPRGESFSVEDLGGFTFYVSGYEPVTITEFYRSHVAGVTDYHVDYVCLIRVGRGDD